MGLAASQARLLSITARMHDVEYQAQNIMNQKVELATQEDAVYEDYCAALDAKKIKVAFSKGTSTNYVDATFKNVCTFDETGCRKCQYALTETETGRMVVEQEVFDNYQEYSEDKYSFAWAMLGFIEGGNYSDFSWGDNWGNNIGINSGVGDEGADGHIILLMTDAEEAVYNNHQSDTTLVAAYNDYQDSLKGDDLDKQKEALEYFRDVLYSDSTRKTEIYNMMRLDKSEDKEEAIANQKYISDFPDEFDDEMNRKFEYYMRIFEGIQTAGGCITIDQVADGKETDNDWFNNVISSGRVILSIYNTNGPNKGWQETSVATSVNENYLKEASLDEIEVRKAEAKYEHELNKIKKKDADFDKDLQKLETERTALKTEMDSIKKVKDDNIERTFGMFS